MLAAGAPELHQVLAGTLVGGHRGAGTPADGNDLWSSGTHKQFGGTIQFLATPAGTPGWVLRRRTGLGGRPDRRPPAPPGRLLPGPLVAGLPILADAGYEGAGIGVPTPVKKRPGATHQHPHPDNQAYNQLLRGVRSLGARAAAELKERWRALNHITLSPHRIGHIAQAALVLNNAWR